MTREQVKAMFAKLRAEGKLGKLGYFVEVARRNKDLNLYFYVKGLSKISKKIVKDVDAGKVSMSMDLLSDLEEFSDSSPDSIGYYEPSGRSKSAREIAKKMRKLGVKGQDFIGSLSLDYDNYFASPLRGRQNLPNKKNLLRTHVDLASLMQKQRVGTAMYLLGLREAKRHGWGGLYSNKARSKAAARTWKNIKTGSVKSKDQTWDYLTSVKPHAKRRGQKLKAKRHAQKSTTQTS